MHGSIEEYADRPDHRYPEGGSVGFSADGKLVWAHVRGPLAGSDVDPDIVDEWLLLDAQDGRLLARANAEAAAAGSEHLPHPTDPHQMGLSIGEGQDGAPLRWGRWDGRHLIVDHFEGQDLTLISVSPSGGRLMTVTHDQYALAVRSTQDGSVIAELDSEAVVPRHSDAEPENDEAYAYWDWAGGFLDESRIIGATSECDEEWGEGRHWLIDAARDYQPEQITYPSPISGEPTSLGNGMWYTHSQDRHALHVWTLQSSPKS
jgi:hypothetical protein